MRHTPASPARRRLAQAGLAVALTLAGAVIVQPSAAFAATTTLMVSTTADIAAGSGACGSNATTPPSPLSLREATCLADNISLSTGNAITINVPAGTYNLTSGELQPGSNGNATITITGAGAGATVVNAGGASRVFDLDANVVGGVTVDISGLTITGGSDSSFGGGGIIGGSASATTGDTLTLHAVTVTDNASSVGSPAATNKSGGGVQFAGGSLTITNSTISNNTSNSSPGTGVAYGAQGSAAGEHLTISNTTFSGNYGTNTAGTAQNNGGALYVKTAVGGTSYDVTDSRFVNNSITSSTGGATGGAILAGSGTLNVSGSTFTGNTVSGGNAQTGGAIQLNNATADLHYNRFTQNVAGTGSALAANASTVDAASNWWGCNTGPDTTGCDTVSGGATVAPRLVLTASASPATIVGPNATSTITAGFTTDSLGATVGGAQLTAFAGQPIRWQDPQPGDATVSSSVTAVNSGQSSTTYNSHTGSGPGHVLATFDNATVTAAITVNQAPAITSGNTAAFDIGQAGSFTVTTTGYPTASITESGTLPNGLTFVDNGDGTATLSGTPAAGSGGTYPLSVTAANGVNPDATQTLTVSVDQPPAFTSAATATFTAGSVASFTVTTSGSPTATVSRTGGTLPSGLSFAAGSGGTATISGTPAAGTGGTYSVTLSATNRVDPDATQTLTITVQQAPAVTANPSSQTVNPGASVTFSAAASGYPTPTVQWQRSTDGGASFSNIAGATSTGYTPTTAGADSGKRYRAVFTNVVGSATTTAATLTVGSAPTVSSSNTTTFEVGTAGSFTVTTAGFPDPTLTTSGTLPSWLTFTDRGNGTATLTGTPPVGAGGSYPFTVLADNGFSPSDSQAFTLNVDESPTITSADSATFTVGAASSFAVTTSAGFPVATTVTESGILPGGITFTANGSGGATLSGTPAAGTGGSYPITISASATGGSTSARTQSFTLTVTDPPTITSTDSATFTVGQAGSFTVRTAGGNPSGPGDITLTESGALPAGVTFADRGDGTAVLSGSPAVDTGGSYPFAITATNGVGPDATQSFTLTVRQPPRFTSADLTTFTLGAAAAFTVTTSSGVPATPVAITVTDPTALPAGITLVDQGDGTAILGGTPTAGGVFHFSLRAGNTVAPDATQSFTVTVNEAPSITSADHTTFTVGTSGTFTVITNAGTPAATTLSETGSLPRGVTFAGRGNGTATLSGTPATGTGGGYSLTIRAKNAGLPATSQSFTLTITESAVVTSTDHTTFTAGTHGSFTFTTSGDYPAPPRLSASGNLPDGVTFVAYPDGTATLSGTATAGGVYPLTITASKNVLPQAQNARAARSVQRAAASTSDISQSFTLTVNAPPTITSQPKATFTAGLADTFTVTTRAGVPAPTTLSATGPLPEGITFTPNPDGTATLSGTATASTLNTYPITLTASNGVDPDATQAFELTIVPPPPVLPSPSPVLLVPASPAEPIGPSGGGTPISGTPISGTPISGGGGAGGLANTGPDTDPRSTAGYAALLTLTGFSLLFLSRRRPRGGAL